VKKGEKMNIYFRPSRGRGNKYVGNMIETIKNCGFNIINKKHGHNFYPMIFLRIFWRLFKRTKIFHFNWIINNYARDNNIKDKFRVKIIQLWMILMKKIGVKFIWTMHNKKPHDLVETKLALKFRDFLLQTCDKIVIHSKNSKKYIEKIMGGKSLDKLYYIPHGNYINNYKIAKKDYRNKYKLKENDFVFLYFGIIREYKNLDILIEAFKDINIINAKLLICGNPINKRIKKKIERISKDENIILDMRFIKDNEINKIFKTADVTVLPYSKESVLNSGTVLLSYSLKKPSIISKIPSIQDIKNKSFVFSYNYSDAHEHLKKLKKILKNVYQKYYNNYDNLKKEGNKAYDYVKKYNNWSIVEKRLKKLYNKLS